MLAPLDIFDLIFYASTLLYLPFVILFYKNRSIHPISGRFPLLILAIDINLYLLGIDYVSSFIPGIPCFFRNFFITFPPLIVLTIGTCRLVHLLFSYRISQNVMEYQQLGGKNWKESWYSRHRWILHPKNFKRFIFFQYLFYLLAYLFIISIDPTTTTLNECDWNSERQVGYTGFILLNEFLLILLCVITGLALRRNSGDLFSLKIEMSINFYCLGLALVLVIIFLVARFSSSVLVAAYFMCVHTCFLTGTVFPYYLSTKTILEINTPSQKEAYAAELGDIIKDREGFQLFLKHLEKEFSSENLLFWEEVERFKTIDFTNFNLLKQNILSIYNTFCNENACFQTNLPHDLRNGIEFTIQKLFQYENLSNESMVTGSTRNTTELRALNSGNSSSVSVDIDQKQVNIKLLDNNNSQSILEEFSHIFDLAQKNIFDLMNSDSFPRFRQGPDYESYHTSFVERMSSKTKDEQNSHKDEQHSQNNNESSQASPRSLAMGTPSPSHGAMEGKFNFTGGRPIDTPSKEGMMTDTPGKGVIFTFGFNDNSRPLPEQQIELQSMEA